MIVGSTFAYVVLIVFACTWLIQMIFHWGVFSRLAFYKKTIKSTNYEPVSVIVCARDAYDGLVHLVPKLISQDYPVFEIIIVNDCSEDETAEYLKNVVRKHKNVSVVSLTQHLNFFHGKKFPLSMGIKSAKYDLLLLTDADCVPTDNQWIKSMVGSYGTSTELVLGYGPYMQRKTLLNKLIRFDTLYTAMQYLSMALCRHPYMGVGRNLSYRKSTFYRNKGFTSHYGIASGDDDLFVSQAANHWNTEVSIEAETRVESEPKNTLGSWLRQKRRHYSTGLSYKPETQLFLGLLLSSRLFYYTSLIFLLYMATDFRVHILGVALIHYITQVTIYSLSAKKLGEKNLCLIFTPFYDCFFTIFTTVMGFLGSFFKPKSW